METQTNDFSLPVDLTDRILDYLGCKRRTPSIRFLNCLIRAYIRCVPWESVSRIVKRHSTVETRQCPRWPEEFWNEALADGTGGTCFEGNLAFYSLLTTLGYKGYLTINDMENPACHTASVILFRRRKYLVDVAVPIPCAIPIEDKKISRRSTAFHIFAIRPMGGSRYLVERSHHPRRSIFTLLDIPIKMDAYKQAVENDYDKTGYFLDCVIILKVIGDKLWRFSSRDKPYKLEGFEKTNREEQILSPDDLSGPLASHFGISASKIAAAVSYLPVQGLAR